MNNRSVMQHAFSRIPRVKAPRSVFNRSHGHKTSFDCDGLVPIFVDEVLPGDTVNLKGTFLIRLLSAAIRPFMDNLWFDTFWFFVPNRLLWSNFKKFMGEQTNPNDSISYNVPQVTGPNVAAGGIPIGHLFDYMGLPVGPLSGGGGTTGITFNNLHGRAYNQIWNYWFRSELLQSSVTQDLGDGPDTFSNYNLLKRGKRFDYFTSALPNAQRGSAVMMPLGTSAPVLGIGKTNTTWAGASTVYQSGGTGGTVNYTNSSSIDDASTNTQFIIQKDPSYNQPLIYADLTNASAPSINALRQNITLQQFLERDERGGTRYPELVLSHFGVENPDARMQVPELLGTFRERVNLTPVANTAGVVDTSSPTGSAIFPADLSGFGSGAFHGHGFQKSFTEHGVLLGLCAVTADLTYTQGMDRMWSRRTRYDFFWPTFAHLGEQTVLNREIYANVPDGSSTGQKDGAFGYMPYGEDYRFKNSKITCDLRSYNGNTVNGTALDMWTLSEAFSSLPTLGSTFIQSAVPLDRCIQVPDQRHFILDAFFEMKHARVMPVFGVPGLTRL